MSVKPANGERKVPNSLLRIFRGGGFDYSAFDARSAYRYSNAPEGRYNHGSSLIQGEG